MKGILNFQVTGGQGDEEHKDEETTREDMLQQIACVQRIGYKSECVYHLNGSITIQMHMNGKAYTCTITGRFERIG